MYMLHLDFVVLQLSMWKLWLVERNRWDEGSTSDDFSPWLPPGKLTCPLKINGWKMYVLLK